MPGTTPVTTIVAQDCDLPDLTYDPKRRQVTLCYQLLVYLSDSFDDLSGSQRERSLGVLDATAFLVLRELGRSHLGQDRQLPLDQQSPQTAKKPALASLPQHLQGLSLEEQLDEWAIVLPALTTRDGASVSLSGVQWLFNQGKPLAIVQNLPYWSQAGFDLQRYERMICLAYGTDPKRFPFLANELERSQERLKGCPAQSQAMVARWRRWLRA